MPLSSVAVAPIQFHQFAIAPFPSSVHCGLLDFPRPLNSQFAQPAELSVTAANAAELLMALKPVISEAVGKEVCVHSIDQVWLIFRNTLEPLAAFSQLLPAQHA
jgi:hypothetical protein